MIPSFPTLVVQMMKHTGSAHSARLLLAEGESHNLTQLKTKEKRPVLLIGAPRLAVSFLLDLRHLGPAYSLGMCKYRDYSRGVKLARKTGCSGTWIPWGLGSPRELSLIHLPPGCSVWTGSPPRLRKQGCLPCCDYSWRVMAQGPMGPLPHVTCCPRRCLCHPQAGSNSPGQRVCVIDEVGKMELFSQPFIQAVRQTLSTPGTIILGTIPVPKGKPLALVEEIRTRNDVKVLSVSTPGLWPQRDGAGS